MDDKKDISGKLVLEYNGDAEQHYKEYFDSRIEVLEWHLKQYKNKIERAEKRIKKLTPAPIGDLPEPDWKEKVAREEANIRHWENIIENHLYEPIGWLYEIKHEIMKID